MDVSDYLKSGHQSLYKLKSANLGVSLNMIREVRHTQRRNTRNAIMLSKRQISKNMSPYVTPNRSTLKGKENSVAKRIQPEVGRSKRYEQLLKWKQEKEKRIKEQKSANRKPMFKVAHVPVQIGLPNLENVNKEIKGKLIVTTARDNTYNFAPANHKFKAPNNLKPVLNPVRSKRVTRTPQSKAQHTQKVSSNNRPQMTAHYNDGKDTPRKVKKQQDLAALMDCKRVTRSQKAVLPNVELPNRRRKLNINIISPDLKKPKIVGKSSDLHAASVGNATKDKKLKKDASTKQLKVAAWSGSVQNEKVNEKLLVQNKMHSKKVILNVQSESEITPKSNSKVYKKTPAKLRRNEDGNNLNNVTPNVMQRTRSKQFSCDDINEDHALIAETLYDISKTKEKPLETENINKNGYVKNGSSRKSINKNPVIVANEAIEQSATKTPMKTKIHSPLNVYPRRSKRLSKVTIFSQDIVDNKKLTEAVQTTVFEFVSVENNMEEDLMQSTNQNCNTSTKLSRPVELELKEKHDKDDTVSDPLCISLHESIGKVEKSSTPSNKKRKEVVYISPFVTISRGKSSARKEYIDRRSKGGAYDTSPDIQISTGPKAGARYFHHVLNQEISRIQALCDEWNQYKDTQNPPEGAIDMINVAIGQSQLLLSKKFKQFRGLICSCEEGTSDIPITCEDLHGYWDTAYIQVENVNKRFENLENLKANKWQEILPEKKTVQNKKKLATKKPKVQATSSLKDAIKAARKKAQSRKTQDTIIVETVPESVNAVDDKFLTLRSPHASRKSDPTRKTPGRPRKSLLISVLASETKKRKSSLGLSMLKASQISRSLDASRESNETPVRSILKLGDSQSSMKKLKSVLFSVQDGSAGMSFGKTGDLNEKPNLDDIIAPNEMENFQQTPGGVEVLTNVTNSGTGIRRSSRSRLSRNKLF